MAEDHLKISKQELASFAISACGDYACNTSYQIFGIIPKTGTESGTEPDSGTAVLAKTPKGTLFLLTARHVLEDLSGVKLYLVQGGNSSRPRGIPDKPKVGPIEFVAKTFLGPKRPGPFDSDYPRTSHIDVGAIALTPEVRSLLEDRPYATLATNPEILEDDLVMLAGYPGDSSRWTQDHLGFVNDLCPMSYPTNFEGIDPQGRYKIHWGEATIGNHPLTGEPPDTPPHLSDQALDTPFILRHPHGISGGGLWRGGKASPQSNWSPTQHCQLIGIASVYRSGEHREYCEPINLWREWLTEVESEVDTLALDDG